ncbi:cation:proton antiporter [Roseibium polysiphoniae]|uniref:Cation:proton antiporter n=1 Tax=Roseibium polysiphoniae TaxID=2571221 RepID=A0ABR9C4I6_9HYPH|nr:cation:proton antiporter [Roseibium polysiphoniae]MBD8874749.1 cation:proton antiporter [Roseibium polysiphoniae]
METPIIVAAFAGLLVTISLLQPLARKLGLSPSVLLAMVGTLIGIAATYLLYTPRTDAFNELALVFVDPPIDSEKILYIFLPILLFQTTLTLDVRRIFEDIGPILVMAIVAVFVATFFIGFALYPLAGFSLVTCLLLGSIVATTDPVAVVGIFRDIGAPPRLGRIVEGESLLNDAAAIVLFVILLGILTGTQSPDASEAAIAFFRSFIGGVIVGTLMARACVMALPIMRDLPLAQVTLSLALPYLIYVISDQFADVSAVVAVVAAGIVFNLYGPSRIAPKNWTFLQDVWEQIAFWASSLIFVLASIMIPKLVAGFTELDILLLLILVVAALAARAVVIFGLLPILSVLKVGERVNVKFKTVMLWGGMRGAVTLTLALSVSEHAALSDEISSFITKLATGFVLFTLLVYGSSLKPLIKLLKLNRLSPRDEALRNQFLVLALSDVRQGITEAANAYQIAPELSERVTTIYEERTKTASESSVSLKDLKDKERVILGLVALADRERELVLKHFHEKTISNRAVSKHLAAAGRIGDLTRTEGRAGYNRATRAPLQFGIRLRFAQWLHRRLKIQWFLSNQISDRFEFLLVSRIVAGELIAFNQRRIRPLVGDRVGGILNDTLCARREEILRAIEALRLQYPDYADAQEVLFLRNTGLRLEETAYADAHSQALIGAELYNDLTGELSNARLKTHQRPKLDLGMRTEDLLGQHELFSSLSDARRRAVAKLMRPRFAIPGEKLIQMGDKGDTAFFISSGAVEVRTANSSFRLGRGEMFGEIALITGKPRSADVKALGYCQLLTLSAADYRTLVDQAPDIKAHMDSLSSRRQSINAGKHLDTDADESADKEST